MRTARQLRSRELPGGKQLVDITPVHAYESRPGGHMVDQPARNTREALALGSHVYNLNPPGDHRIVENRRRSGHSTSDIAGPTSAACHVWSSSCGSSSTVSTNLRREPPTASSRADAAPATDHHSRTRRGEG